MHLEGSHVLDADKSTVWNLLNDPDVLARTTPGVKKLVPQGDDRYEAVLHIKLGPINTEFHGNMAVVDKVEEEYFRLLIDVDAKIGIVAAEGKIQLKPNGQGTLVEFVGDAKLSGKLAAMGQRVLSAVARMFTKQFFRALEQETKEN